MLRYLITILPEGYKYINYAKEKKDEPETTQEDKVSEVVIEKKRKEEPMEHKKIEKVEEVREEGAEKTQVKDKEAPVDKDLDAKLDKILGGDLRI